MATQGTEKVLGGTTYKRYPDPNVSNLPNEYGLYPWSSFRARLAQFDGSGVIQISLITDVSSSLLLFLSDAPSMTRAGYDAGGPYYYSDGDAALSCGLAAPFGCGLVTQPGGATLAQLDAFGKPAVGYTGAANDVYCVGFPALFYFYQPIESDYALFVEATANGPVVSSPLSGNARGNKRFPVTKTGTGLTPIILRSTDYTDAIKANNNIIVCDDLYGTYASVSYVVVGLWFVPGPD